MALVQIQFRRDTAASWTAANPVPASGEPCLETDTGKVKYGDGVRSWTTLPYASDVGLSSSTPAAVGTAAAGTSSLASRSDHVHALPAALSVTSVTTTGNVTVGGTLTVNGAVTASSLAVASDSVTGLSEAIDDRVAAYLTAGTGITLTNDDAANRLTVAVGTHAHAISDITGLQAALGGGGVITHTHALADVTGLSAALAERPTSATITNIVSLTQAAYDALSPKSSTTLYIIS